MIDKYKQPVARFLAKYEHACSKVKDEKAALKISEELVETLTQAQQLVQRVAKTTQELCHKQIAMVVTRCLQTVFGEEDAYQFKINFSEKRGKTEAELVFVRDEHEIDPTEASGGGVIDVASFALRLACLLLAQPKRRRFLALDESFKHLSSDYRPVVREMLEVLAKEKEVQFLLITHSEELTCGKVIEL